MFPRFRSRVDVLRWRASNLSRADIDAVRQYLTTRGVTMVSHREGVHEWRVGDATIWVREEWRGNGYDLVIHFNSDSYAKHGWGIDGLCPEWREQRIREGVAHVDFKLKFAERELENASRMEGYAAQHNARAIKHIMRARAWLLYARYIRTGVETLDSALADEWAYVTRHSAPAVECLRYAAYERLSARYELCCARDYIARAANERRCADSKKRMAKLINARLAAGGDASLMWDEVLRLTGKDLLDELIAKEAMPDGARVPATAE